MNKSGFSLIQVLVAIGIMSIVLLGMLSMFQTQQQEVRSLRQKYETIELKNAMILQLVKPDVCTWQLKDKTIDVSLPTTESSPSPTVILLDELREGLNATSALLAKKDVRLPLSTSGIVVDQISFQKIYATGNPDEYRGVFEVSFSESSLVRAIRPVQFQQVVRVVGADPASAKRIDTCGATSASGPTLVTGEEDLNSTTPFSLNCEYRWITSTGYGGPGAFKALLVTPDRLWWRERDYSSTMIYRTNKKVAVGQYGGIITNIYRICP